MNGILTHNERNWMRAGGSPDQLADALRLAACNTTAGGPKRSIVPRFVDAPEVSYRLEEFNLDITFYSRNIPRVTTGKQHRVFVIGKMTVCPAEMTRQPENRSIVEHDDGPGFFPVGWQVRMPAFSRADFGS